MDANEVQILNLADHHGWTAAPGVQMRAIFGTAAMLNLVDLRPHARVRLHSHAQEQIGFVAAGTLIIEIDGAKHRLRQGDAYAIPGNIEHGGQAGPDGCAVIDVFQPIREDYRSAMQTGEAVS
jgi:unsaturated pyranuronate lyase